MSNFCRILSLVQQWLPIRLQLPLTPRPEIRWLTMKWVFFFSKSHLFLHHAFSFCLGENCVRTIFGLKCKMCSLGGNRSFGWKICKVERVQGWPEGQHHWHQRRWYEGEHLYLQQYQTFDDSSFPGQPHRLDDESHDPGASPKTLGQGAKGKLSSRPQARLKTWYHIFCSFYRFRHDIFCSFGFYSVDN